MGAALGTARPGRHPAVGSLICLTLLVASLAVGSMAAAPPHARPTFSNPLWSGADPYVIRDGGYYYFTFCDGDKRIYVSKSKTLVDRGEIKLVCAFPDGQWNSYMVWGPASLFKWTDGKWYIYYCAADGPTMDYNVNHRAGVLAAETADPQGPYTDLTSRAPLDTGNAWAINPHPFQDLAGEWYVVWSGWRGPRDGFPQRTYLARMINPWTLGPRVQISLPDRAWETSQQPIQEGHTVFNKSSRLYLLYAANASWTDDYCLGLLTYAGGDILDPGSWRKSPEPVMRQTGKVKGPGGPSVTTSPDGREYWLVYHANQYPGSGWSHRYICAKKIEWDKKGYPVFGTPIPYAGLVDLPSGDLGVPQTQAFDCNWDDGRSVYWTEFGGDWTVGEALGSRQLILSAGDDALYLAKQTSYADFVYEADLALTVCPDPSDAGLVFWVSRPCLGKNAFDGYYAGLDVRGRRLILGRAASGSWKILAKTSLPLALKQAYHLKIVAKGSNIEVYINDMAQLKLKVKDGSFPAGSIGVRGRGAYARWDNLVSRALP